MNKKRQTKIEKETRRHRASETKRVIQRQTKREKLRLAYRQKRMRH